MMTELSSTELASWAKLRWDMS